jgi:hypothetical protein
MRDAIKSKALEMGDKYINYDSKDQINIPDIFRKRIKAALADPGGGRGVAAAEAAVTSQTMAEWLTANGLGRYVDISVANFYNDDFLRGLLEHDGEDMHMWAFSCKMAAGSEGKLLRAWRRENYKAGKMTPTPPPSAEELRATLETPSRSSSRSSRSSARSSLRARSSTMRGGRASLLGDELGMAALDEEEDGMGEMGPPAGPAFSRQRSDARGSHHDYNAMGLHALAAGQEQVRLPPSDAHQRVLDEINPCLEQLLESGLEVHCTHIHRHTHAY